MVNPINKNTQSFSPELEQFRLIAAQKDDRVISKQGEVKEPSTFHRGQKFTLINEKALKSKYPKFYQENIKTHLDFKQALLKKEKPDIALLAFSLVSPSGYRGEPLTERKIFEVVNLLEEIKVDDSSYQQLKSLFDIIGRDPRLQIMLEQHYPGKMDGFSAELLNFSKEKLKTQGPTTLLNAILPGVGSLISIGRNLYKTSKHCDSEAYLHQMEQITKLTNKNKKLSIPMMQTLAFEHAKLSAEGAISATLTTVKLGVSGGFGVSGVAITPKPLSILTKTIENSTMSSIASSAASVGKPALNFAGNHLLNKEMKDLLHVSNISGVLPRIEVSNNKGNFTFSMQNAASVRALMAYLGPKEDESMTSVNASRDVQDMESARLTLKKMLGSDASEHLIPSTQSSLRSDTRKELLQTESIANGALKKLLNEDWDWLVPAIKAIEQGKTSEINTILTYTLPLDTPNGQTYLKKSPNLNDEQIFALEQLGSPSQLRLMYLAEGWI
ncbi:cation transporter [Vibrio harveyi]|uniref:hypothetical protein n=1 Tax=Vibrio TaxID=662 RepID=UPI0006804917|nr:MULTISPECIES: hypothetical protein [Vibrio]APP09160.1 cation transporter [Vibrio harveyi]MDA0126115.1 CesT family type III secretion system chaperone [Vibrio sp. MM46]GBL01157.1 cation transporter [Vibrio harveyi]